MNKSCYYFSKKKADYNEARRVCANMTAHLATVSDQFENKMLTEAANSLVGGGDADYLYIGNPFSLRNSYRNSYRLQLFCLEVNLSVVQ